MTVLTDSTHQQDTPTTPQQPSTTVKEADEDIDGTIYSPMDSTIHRGTLESSKSLEYITYASTMPGVLPGNREGGVTSKDHTTSEGEGTSFVEETETLREKVQPQGAGNDKGAPEGGGLQSPAPEQVTGAAMTVEDREGDGVRSPGAGRGGEEGLGKVGEEPDCPAPPTPTTDLSSPSHSSAKGGCRSDVPSTQEPTEKPPQSPKPLSPVGIPHSSPVSSLSPPPFVGGHGSSEEETPICLSPERHGVEGAASISPRSQPMGDSDPTPSGVPTSPDGTSPTATPGSQPLQSSKEAPHQQLEGLPPESDAQTTDGSLAGSKKPSSQAPDVLGAQEELESLRKVSGHAPQRKAAVMCVIPASS